MVCPNNECPYDHAIKLIGNKWSLRLIKTFLFTKEAMRFNEILQALEPVSSKTLSAKLKELMTHEIIAKEVVSLTPLVATYRLTKKGEGLQEVFAAMAKWGKTY